MMRALKQYRFALGMAAVVAVVAAISPGTGAAALRSSAASTRDMLALLPPVLVIIGLIEAWVPREVIVRHVGPGAGIRGVLFPLLLGSVAAGPLYAAFPLAAVLLAKGARPANVFFFLGVWSSSKLPILMFEAGVMGSTFTALHVGVSLVAYYLFAVLMERLLQGRLGPDATVEIATRPSPGGPPREGAARASNAPRGRAGAVSATLVAEDDE